MHERSPSLPSSKEKNHTKTKLYSSINLVKFNEEKSKKKEFNVDKF